MERATVYRAISGPTALFAGVLAIGAGIWFRSNMSNFVLSWYGVLFCVVCFNTWMVIAKARREKRELFSPGLKMALISISPALLVGGILALFGVNEYQPRYAYFLVWMWMVCYGLALTSTRSFSPASMWWLGIAFIVTGVYVSSQFSWGNYEDRMLRSIKVTPNLLMIYTFGFYHIVYGLWVMFIEKDRS
jgi:hypothetical protein